MAWIWPMGTWLVHSRPTTAPDAHRATLIHSSPTHSQHSFEVSQDPDFLPLAIWMPQGCTTKFNLYLGADFKFYTKLYFLRFRLSARVVENGSKQGTCDADKVILTV